MLTNRAVQTFAEPRDKKNKTSVPFKASARPALLEPGPVRQKQ